MPVQNEKTMRVQGSPRTRSLSTTVSVAIFILLLSTPLLVACDIGGGSESDTVRVVTATFTPGPIVIEVTATFTPLPALVPTEAVLSPEPPVATAEEIVPEPTAVEVQPEPTEAEVQLEPTVVEVQPTETLVPTDTPAPPTDTPPPPEPTNTPRPQPTSTPRASLSDYKVVYGQFDGGDQTDENKYSVWLMRGDGSHASKIRQPGFEPTLSSNGNKVVYYRPWTGLWIYNMVTEADVQVINDPYAEFGSLSPDGSRLLYHQFVGNWWSMDVNIYVANADGSGVVQLPQGIRPAWGPDGNTIAFDTCRGTACGIFVMGADGQGFRQVTSDGGGKVSWSPNGNKLVYSAESDGDPEIWRVNADGSGREQLTHNTGNDTLPVYSPDGKFIFFLSDQNGRAWAIRAMRADGSDVQTIRQIGVPPRWQFSRLWVSYW